LIYFVDTLIYGKVPSGGLLVVREYILANLSSDGMIYNT